MINLIITFGVICWYILILGALATLILYMPIICHEIKEFFRWNFKIRRNKD